MSTILMSLNFKRMCKKLTKINIFAEYKVIELKGWLILNAEMTILTDKANIDELKTKLAKYRMYHRQP